MLAFGRQGRLLRSAYKSSGAGGSAATNVVVASTSTLRPSSAAAFSTTTTRADQKQRDERAKSVTAGSSRSASKSKSSPKTSADLTAKESGGGKETKQKSTKQKGLGPMQFDLASFPSLLSKPHPVLDAYTRYDLPVTKSSPYGGSATIYNDPKYFSPSPPSAASIIDSGGSAGGLTSTGSPDQALASSIPLTSQEVSRLHRHLLTLRRVVQQTGKGRQARMSAFIVTGNGKGMVGIGDGKDTTASIAVRKAYHDAVRNMDYVERADGHTIPSTMTAKWSSTVVVLRPRPPGFGLRVPPVIHAIARCAGIADLSATIHRSTNPLNVAKATLKMLWGGSAPQGMGNGVEGRMRRVDKGRGLRSVRDIEMARGRRLREVGAGKE